MEQCPFMDESLIEHCDFPYVPWPKHDIYIIIYGYGHPSIWLIPADW